VRKKIKIISSTSLIQGLKSGQFFTTLPNITIFPTKINKVNQEFSDIFLHIFNPTKNEQKVIMASKGKILHKKDEKTGIESFKLFLEDGNIINNSSGNKDMEKILFKEYTLPISEKRFSYKTSLKEIMMNLEELSEMIDNGLEAALAKGFKKREFKNARFEYWQRWNTPLLCILFTFIGFGLGVSSNRGKSKNGSTKSVGILIGYYILYFAFVSFGKDGHLPAQMAVIVPGFFLFFLGCYFYRKMDWLS